MKAHALFGDMTKLADRIDGAHDAVRDRMKGLPDDRRRSRTSCTGCSTRSTRPRSRSSRPPRAARSPARSASASTSTQLYGALDGWEGRPAKYQLDAHRRAAPRAHRCRQDGRRDRHQGRARARRRAQAAQAAAAARRSARSIAGRRRSSTTSRCAVSRPRARTATTTWPSPPTNATEHRGAVEAPRRWSVPASDAAPHLSVSVSIGAYSDETEVRIEPFDAVPLDVASWWPPPGSVEEDGEDESRREL